MLVEFPYTKPFVTALKAADSPAAVLSYIAQNRGQADAIARLDPASALVALGKIVALVDRREDAAPASSSPARITKAAPPLRQVGGRQSIGGADEYDEKDPNDWTAADLPRILASSKSRR